MAEYKDYIKPKEGTPEEVSAEITEAAAQQQARDDDATPVDWEERYKDLEQHNSRQAQDLGRYKQLMDEYILSPTPAEVTPVEREPITIDAFYENPDEAISKAVESHPAIQEAKQIKVDRENDLLKEAQVSFEKKHTDYTKILSTPEFANWLNDDATRVDLARRANAYDFSAADALFTLFKAEQAVRTVQAEVTVQKELEQASLEAAGAGEPPAPVLYSRVEFREQMIRAKQGDPKAERYVSGNIAKYRQALADKNVRD